MNGLETIWDIDDNGGQSTVQRFGDRCLKLYPLQDARYSCVTREELQVYHRFQGSLQPIEIDILDTSESHYSVLRQLGYDKIKIDFLDLSGVEISLASSMNTKRDILVTTPPFIEGISLVKANIGTHIMKLVRIHVLQHRQSLIGTLNMNNMKILSNSEENVISIICTDAFWNIPKQVNDLLELV